MDSHQNQAGRRWSRRVDPLKIRRLYESDARGMLDRELLDDVGYGIYCRCQDMIEVSEAWRGRVRCWGCGNVLHRRQGKLVAYAAHGPTRIGGNEEMLTCDRCGWQIAWGNYRKGLSGQNLGTVVEDMATYVDCWPFARSPQTKLLLIDALIHAFHCWDGDTVGSPVGATVIRASAEEVLALLDELAYGPGSTRGLAEVRQRWAARLEAQKAQRPLSELRAIARELGIRGRSRMRRPELQAAIERVAPERIREKKSLCPRPRASAAGTTWSSPP
jgi:hypothetical protein